jgi:hypothetical protein
LGERANSTATNPNAKTTWRKSEPFSFMASLESLSGRDIASDPEMIRAYTVEKKK